MRVGLYFGTFDPIHIGHLIVANQVLEHTDLEKIWIVVSPQNPFKDCNSILLDSHRLKMAFIAVEKYENISVSDVEFKLPRPSYTFDTLEYIKGIYPDLDFSLIMGGDSIDTFHKWKNYKSILDNHRIYVYPRTSEQKKSIEHPNIILLNFPIIQISATYIRNSIKQGKSIRPFLNERVLKYISINNLYNNCV
ncbi:nicotinate (nicotinamide) nucleotide adenylyltransferase [Ichthyobacterium seriolicida]|uniref:Probable nicotinate-nucleotide adenylyltransferase n=1 Tax=Ichthyobacterium seriolicida TaxID=242600 RepID=A0A1J1ECE9_9FLAO|nr:nicotinate (nicotinamide) nucleotide adenylyltransferase [Ichthyobacterium seriolicida]BAV95184.1 nicotinic acid mononucleotide adenylyltransferase [Ichthyobacterium seriolicida]